ncbi:unnamed protein product [Arctia plantaginis]|uniref:Uncharacterized protein n=1 Tax=Arctia plantaginis TaxID=874455 RepID=A0A8S1BC65_ARCPL|nr:unnamed protein product [Arctia plantaginis]CAB3260361.1 unnamed protein product [Arctia plantaginis]
MVNKASRCSKKFINLITSKHTDMNCNQAEVKCFQMLGMCRVRRGPHGRVRYRAPCMIASTAISVRARGARAGRPAPVQS